MTLVAPVFVALLLDLLLATLPLITMVVAVICIPLATFVVMRAALSELDRVIKEVAPPVQADDDTASFAAATDDETTDSAVTANEKGNGAPDATN